MGRNEKELGELQNMIEKLKNDPDKTEQLKKEIKDRDLMDTAKAFEKQYAGKINDFIASMNERGEMTNEEKAKMVLEMKNKLPKRSQEQFSQVLGAMKDYLKKM